MLLDVSCSDMSYEHAQAKAEFSFARLGVTGTSHVLVSSSQGILGSGSISADFQYIGPLVGPGFTQHEPVAGEHPLLSPISLEMPVSRSGTTRSLRRLDVAVTGTALGARPFMGKMPVRVWPHTNFGSAPEMTDPIYRVPHLAQKDDLAICVPGGGFRAAACALGWLNALYYSGVFQRARYLVATSGSSWLTSCLAFQDKMPVEVFLGPPALHPRDFTPSYADFNTTPGSFAGCLTDADLRLSLLGKLFNAGGQPTLCNWGIGIGKHFLEDFDLFRTGYESTFAVHGAHAESVKARLKAAGRPMPVFTACRSTEAPFPIFTGCLDVPDDPHLYHAYEFTPLSAGCPTTLRLEASVDGSPWIGGCYVEAFAATCRAPQTQDDAAPHEVMVRDDVATSGAVELELHVPETLPVAQVTAISSHCMSQTLAKLTDTAWDIFGFPVMNTWNATDMRNQAQRFTDGGSTDNASLFPALRRGVKKILSFYSPYAPLGPYFHEGAEHDASDAKALAGRLAALSCYFGAFPADGEEELPLQWDKLNEIGQVFRTSAWVPFVSALKSCYFKRKPLAVPFELDVLPNSYQGIAGGYRVQVLFFVMSDSGAWFQPLPAATLARVSALEHFPHTPTGRLDYTAFDVSTLSNLSAYSVNEASVMDAIRDLLSGAFKPITVPAE